MIEGAALVLGSLHMDLIARAPRLPAPGESVSGGTFGMSPGGKAGNQAVQLARMGLPTSIACRLGDDHFGRRLAEEIGVAGVNTCRIVWDSERTTGASTVLSGGGDYQSIIAPGAANELDDADIEMMIEESGCSLLVLQLEIPVDRSLHAARLAKGLGATIALNASPFPDAPDSALDELLSISDVVVVNQIEATRMLGGDLQRQPGALCRALRERSGVETCLITFGAHGAAGCSATGCALIPGIPADVVDTVGAGDAFLGAALSALVEGRGLVEALRWGVAAGSLAVRVGGAYAALPHRERVTELAKSIVLA